MSRDQEGAEDKVHKLEWAPYSVDYGFYSPLMSGSIDGTDTRPHDRGVVRAMSVECKKILSVILLKYTNNFSMFLTAR